MQTRGLGATTHPVATGSRTILVVTEDPEFTERVRYRYKEDGCRVVACLGPSQSPCLMDVNGTCGLVEHSSVVLVDSPRSGVFGGRWGTIPAGTYAEKLAARHPDAFVVLSAALGTAGPTGEVATVRDRGAALSVIDWLLR